MADAEPIGWKDIHAYLDELRVVAQNLLALEGNAMSLQATALVNSALRRQLPGGTERRTGEIDWDAVTWPNRQYFFAAAYEAMRRALIDHSRKRGGKRALRTVQFEDIHLENLSQAVDERPEQLEALAEAIERLKQRHPEWAEVVQHRYFSGLTVEDTARFMCVDERTVRRRWNRARILLHDEIVRILNNEGLTSEEGADVVTD